ncbi:MAG: radical SAM protein [Candidatus Omnitrophica bacterium]|nr:radical SAM protein [Candidatus Omnitrophota bacterium]
MFIFGPVPSRRLGRSLGVSPIPAKTCSYSCVYCQIGITDNLQIERQSFFPKEDIFTEIESTLKKSCADYITFAGDGEPTLSSDLGWLIHQCKIKFKIPVAVLTNGSLFFMASVRRDLLEADVVLPTLDAASPEIFRRINQPHPKIDFSLMLKGQVDFRKEYKGKIWLEVMLVDGLNDTDRELKKIKELIALIKPDRVYVNVPIRPPAQPWVKVPQTLQIFKAASILEAEPLCDYEIGEFGIEEFPDARSAILEISQRHPLRKEQAEDIERRFSQAGIIERMLKEGQLHSKEYQTKIYYLPQK